ncbi:MAG: orotate phosphoribosyltransferase [Nitrospirota bacterium]|nr:orotate phosphoribosyltransferase [Nitrospirota bacterium]
MPPHADLPHANLPHADPGRLLELIVRLSYRYSDEGFTLTSGRHSNYYVDLKKTTLHPEGAWLCGRLLFERLRGRGVLAVGGLTLGADPLVSAVAVASHLGGEPMQAIIVRKAAKGHGTGRWVEGPATPPLAVAVLDDVATTGKSTVEAAGRLREAGFDVVAALCVVDRGEGGREALAAEGLTLEALFTMDDILAHQRQKP